MTIPRVTSLTRQVPPGARSPVAAEGAPPTGWRRLRDWHEAGVWAGLHRALLQRLADAEQLDWSRAALDSASVAAKGGNRNGPEPDGSRQTREQAAPRR